MRKYDECNKLISCENCKWCSFTDYFPFCSLKNRDTGLMQVCEEFERYKNGYFEIDI